jgi:DNA-binding MarR family transcriptional regulator
MVSEKLIDDYFQEREKTTVEYYRYLTKPREYLPGVILHMRELELLNAVQDLQEPTVSELSEKLEITHGAVSQTVTRLIKKGLVFRKQNGDDHRYSSITLTELGEQIREIDKHIKTLLRKEVLKAAAHSTDADIQRLIEVDREMRNILSIYKKLINDLTLKT